MHDRQGRVRLHRRRVLPAVGPILLQQLRECLDAAVGGNRILVLSVAPSSGCKCVQGGGDHVLVAALDELEERPDAARLGNRLLGLAPVLAVGALGERRDGSACLDLHVRVDAGEKREQQRDAARLAHLTLDVEVLVRKLAKRARRVLLRLARAEQQQQARHAVRLPDLLLTSRAAREVGDRLTCMHLRRALADAQQPDERDDRTRLDDGRLVHLGARDARERCCRLLSRRIAARTEYANER